MDRLLVIGGASVDVIRLEDRTVESVGGAGMYTAMAAHACGAQVALFGARPNPYPDCMEPVAGHLTTWFGPVISQDRVLRFDISCQGGKTEYLDAQVESERMLSPTMLPADLSEYDLVHVTPLGDPSRQLSFIQACRLRGARQISAGTWPVAAVEKTEALRKVFEQSDYYFMNDLEAKAVFGSLESARTEPGKILFIIQGEKGATIIQGHTATSIPSVPSTLLDPTGAGDTFCGATLAYLLQNRHPIMAARQASVLAAEVIGQVGSTALLCEDPSPVVPLDPRVRLNNDQVQKVAEKISILPQVTPYPFTSPELPPEGHPKALDYFFAATLQQFSFWSQRNMRYDLPLIARISGVERKGSDYLWEAFRRQLEGDTEFCLPERQANLTREELLETFRADNGEDPMPALDLHLEQARQYGRDMLSLQLTPQVVLDKALASPQPLMTFLRTLDHIGGYKEDPLRKKSLLLAMILNDRPEVFLPLREDEHIAPIMDYHFQRSCLRIGLIDVLDEELEDKLSNRQVVTPSEEWAVRYPAYLVIGQLVQLSGLRLSAVNNYLFTNARARCLEMTEPECQRCKLDPVCAHHKYYFQPVLRTSFY